MATSLNPQQQKAVRTLDGPLLVLAGAGSGKTRVVTCRIAELIRRGTLPERILAVTFTNKAAREMRERAMGLLGRPRHARPEISTFHSLCVRILRRQIHHLGYPPTFTIADSHDQETVAKAALREMRVPNESLRPWDLLQKISLWKSRNVPPQAAGQFASTDKEHLAAAAYRRYQNSLFVSGSVDFDDLLLCTSRLFAKFPDVLQAEANRFDYILIDEYQDTNAVQYQIVKALAKGHGNLCVVGDDDQSIYGWRGAEVAHILRFKHDWKAAEVIRLEDNYRSTREIVAVANRLIAHNKGRHAKVLRAVRAGVPPRILQFASERDEAEGVAGDIRQRLASARLEPRDFAILARTNDQTRPFESALRKAKLPYMILGGMSFYDRKEVRDLLAYFKVVVNPRDDAALKRIINVPARGLGAGVVKSLVGLSTATGKPVWDLLAAGPHLAGISPRAHRSIAAFREMILTLQDHGRRMKPRSLAEELLRVTGYRDELKHLYSDPNEQEDRWQSVTHVLEMLSEHESSGPASLETFLDAMAMADREDDREKDAERERNAISLMTLHSAKGLEFQEVYLVGMEEGFLPHRNALDEGGRAVEEERRLCYVGVTRAKDRLTLTLALSRLKYGAPRATIPSRFLYELTGQADHPRARQIRSANEGHLSREKSVRAKS
jgi:DNA helicase-2/ATP-dependent DNA helicase PcrA